MFWRNVLSRYMVLSTSEHRKMERHKERISKIREDLKGFAKGE